MTTNKDSGFYAEAGPFLSFTPATWKDAGQRGAGSSLSPPVSVPQRTVIGECLVRFGNHHLIRQHGDAEVSSMERRCIKPRKPPKSTPGDAEQSTADLPLSADSGGSSSLSARDTQSIAFLSAAEMLLLYSGEGDDQPVMFAENRLQARCGSGFPLASSRS